MQVAALVVEHLVGPSLHAGQQVAGAAAAPGSRTNESASSYLMSGWARLYRFVTSTFADGTPGPTGRLPASTSSMMHMSLLNISTSPPGALEPISPSVEAKLLTTGAPKAAVISARASGSRVSLVEMITTGAMCRRPALCSAARRASAEA